jgi:hypothetical protein
MTTTSNVPPVGDADVEEVIALWVRCGLTRPWNDAAKDIAFARAGPIRTSSWPASTATSRPR